MEGGGGSEECFSHFKSDAGAGVEGGTIKAISFAWDKKYLFIVIAVAVVCFYVKSNMS